MYIYLSKIVPVLVMPVTLLILLIVIATVLVWRGRRRAGAGVLVAALAVLWLSSMPLIAARLYQALEARHPPVALDQLDAAACAVLLGGAVGLPTSPRVNIELGEAVDRLYTAAQLYRAGKAKTLIVTAGNQPWSEPGPSEAALTGELLVEWGVPAAALRLEGKSRNTRENALNTLPILQELGCERPLLVTSAAHMTRALGAFRVLGVEAVPVSADIRVTERGHLAVMDFFPSVYALAMTSDAIREWMGRKVYEWRGWN